MTTLIHALRKATPQRTLSSPLSSMKLSVQSVAEDPVRMTLEGRVSQRDLQLSDPFTDTLGDEAYANNVALDMSEVLSLDSSGVNWLLISQKKMREAGGQLVLHSLSPISLNVLKVLNLHTVFKLAETEDAALRKLGGEV